MTKYPVDLVYLWVDGFDRDYINRYKNINLKLITQDFRFRSNDELKYSLRSVEKYAEWINHIFIVTDNQIPKWLNNKNKKITIVDHREILPKKVKYSFNATAIESCLHRIPNLSEHFLFANDDMFFNKQLNVDYFFDEDDNPFLSTWNLPVSIRNEYVLNLVVANAEINHVFKKTWITQPSHNITAYKKSLFREVVEDSIYAEHFKASMCSVHRNLYDTQRFLISLYLASKKKTTTRKISLKKELYVDAKRKWLINLLNPNLFCINDNDITSEKHLKKVNKYLERKFPNKSEFEK